MRPAGRDRFESLYFDYPQIKFVPPPELRNVECTHPVAIVGAGPVGLTAALELARHGVRCVVLDDKTTLNDGSRAICLARHSFETLQQLGIADKFVSNALGWTNGRSYYRTKQVYTLTMPHSDDERYLPMYNLQQQFIELYLLDAARASSLIELRFASAVENVECLSPDPADSGSNANAHDTVQLRVMTPEGSYALHARFCIAADGARSTVRRSLGLELRGDAYEGQYVIADIQLKSEFPTERRAFFDPVTNPGATLLVHKQPHDIWRVDWQLDAAESADDAVDEQNLRPKIQSILDMLGESGEWALEWWSIYSAFTLCLDDYKHGPVLFAGDAAHLVPIFAVRGLNSGIADAVNAAWKLAFVVCGHAPESLLESYTPERRGATMEIFENAAKSTRFMTPPTRGYQLVRDAALSLSLTHEFARPFLNPRQAAPYTYIDSPLCSFSESESEFKCGPGTGALLTNCRLENDNFLLDSLGCELTLLYFGDGRTHEVADQLVDAVTRDSGVEIKLLRVTPNTPDHADPHTLSDPQGRLALMFDAGVGTAYLIRPDRHVAARWKHLATEPLDIAVNTVLGRQAARRCVAT